MARLTMEDFIEAIAFVKANDGSKLAATLKQIADAEAKLASYTPVIKSLEDVEAYGKKLDQVAADLNEQSNQLKLKESEIWAEGEAYKQRLNEQFTAELAAEKMKIESASALLAEANGKLAEANAKITEASDASVRLAMAKIELEAREKALAERVAKVNALLGGQ